MTTIDQHRIVQDATISAGTARGRAAVSNPEVVIAGGGFVGLALAQALAQGLGLGLGSGIGSSGRIVIASRNGLTAAGADDGRSVALSAASVRLLTALGVWPAIAAEAEPIVAIEITDSALKAGWRPVHLSYDNALDDGEPAARIVPNGRLLAALASAVAARPEITVLAGSEVTAYRAGPDDVTVTVSDGRTLSTRLLVGAEGRNSRVRELAGIGTVGWAYRQHGITVTIAHDKPHGGRAVQHFLPGGPFALLPLPGNRTCITWSEDEAIARRIMALPDDGFLAEVDRRVGGRLGAIRLDGPRQTWPLQMFLARAFVGPRVALVGDAAHNVHPIAGQGLNLGLQDVAALAEVFVDDRRVGLDPGRAESLARYERWRRFDTMTAAIGFDALNRLFSNDIGLLRTVRSMGLGLVDRAPFLKRRLVAEAAGVSGTLPRLLKGEPV
jgi:2-octaprenyl-6-methoxyphenol hydroxylase